MEEKILKTLAEKGAMKAGELAVLIGEEKETVAKEIKKLVKAGKLESPKMCFYAVKP